MSKSNRIARYTVIFDKYEELNEVNLADTSVDLYCFTDDPNLKSDSWKIVLVERELPNDPIRSQRLLKIEGHPVLADYDVWLYTDNSIVLKRPAADFARHLLGEAPLGKIAHSYRENVQGEYEAVIATRKENPAKVYRQAAHYAKEAPEIFHAKPMWGAIFARRNTAEVAAWAKVWADQIRNHSRRDQLSLAYSLVKQPVSVNRVYFDNFESEWHAWVGQKLNRKIKREFWIPLPRPRMPKVDEIHRNVLKMRPPLLKRLPGAIKKRLRPGS